MNDKNYVEKDDTHQIEFLKRLQSERHELGIKEPKSDPEGSIKFIRRKREQKEKASEIKGIEGFETYQNDEHELRFAFECPKNWIINKIATYDKEGLSIAVMGPLNENKTQNAEMKVIITPSEKCGEPDILEKYVDYRVIRDTFKDLKVLSKIKTSFSERNLEAIDTLISYSMPVDSSRSLYVIIKKRILVAKSARRFFEFSYSTDKRDFDKYIEAYEHAKETFRFVE